ncbi:MAG TPA: multifunctional oxoglutarate decarboxylase/oxoglutarate dehydrogenase thiamine pyrophosphate-binding subunit/dihydrolipoyllysine-residue succinyltransferase subunit [Actinomycetota bacterium]|nr:multifunctional oxoglutarate decarboxylase/oxoglutarate dehydrogenase thiamine pyrophosphate-binding subunit/dihydrolipoyllysine-residue succinyltransferase subunit [Actinomycetota bacterium]
MTDRTPTETFGPNDWLVDEMYRRYQQDPDSVAESWRDFFADYRPRGSGATESRPSETRPPEGPAAGNGGPESPRRSAGVVEMAEPPRTQLRAVPDGSPEELPEAAVPLRGAAALIAKNMETSLQVPTATSARVVPAKLLEENRRVINDHLAARSGGKVSFTHLVGWAVLRALVTVPVMNSSYVEIGGAPHVVRPEHVNLGLAVDVKRKDGSRTLLVPNIKNAGTLDFAGFWAAYEDVIRRVRSGRVGADDFAGTTVSLTNPGTIGTVMSVPRLMAGQGLIVGTGAIDYPVEYKGADAETLATLGIGKVMTVTSTYDHRVIQGAESGEFLDVVSTLLSGEHGFYDEIFASLRIPHEPVRWSQDRAAGVGGAAEAASALEKNIRVMQLINMYRVRGHLLADLNPLAWEPRSHLELDPAYYGLTVWDLDREFFTDGVGGFERATLRKVIGILRDAYCCTTGIEYMHIQEAEQKRWIQERMEGTGPDLTREDKMHLLERLNAAEAFERFLHTKYVGHKRFGLEGAESLIPMLSWLLDEASEADMQEAVIGMAHRGRLNVLTNIVGKDYGKVFREFEGDIDPETTQGSGDVKYHLGAKGTYKSRSGRMVTVSAASNPSHLEAVDPVVEGIVRAKQDLAGAKGRDTILPVLIHGDAAFAGQGVVAETLNLSQLPGYKTGGTIHVVVNNGIGFTTSVEAARSSVYATDVAKMVQAPIFHVNGDDPEACVRVMILAFAFRQAFHKDVVVDLMCYRRHGHNEADEPAYTQPLMYSRIEEHRSVRKLYTEALVNRGDLSLEEAEKALEDFRHRLEQALDETRASKPEPVKAAPPRPPRGVLPAVDTGVDRPTLDRVVSALTAVPDGFEPHPKLMKQLSRHAELLPQDKVDWPLAESMAMGSLLLEGKTIRIAGQDTRRGTFSQRHSVLMDRNTGAEYAPLRTLESDGGRFLIYDSLLSEYAALGFEYGYSVGNPEALVMWEAQFGDFVNGAQIVIDQYIVASEDKWGQTCGVVLLLPHGYEGQGPEHSSARLERFLTLCAEDNIQVCYPSLPAQYFHLLRRQAGTDNPKPLIVLTPKSLLRSPVARSAAEDFTSGSFREILGDPAAGSDSDVRRILLSSGKITHELLARREQLGAGSVAIVRVEQLYPFPHVQIDEQLARYSNAQDVVWVQEEPENMGAWSFVFAKLQHQVPGIRPVARPESASPASGSHAVHQQEQEELLEASFEGA